MKSVKRILAAACALLIVCSLAVSAAEPVLAPFSLQDMAVSYVYAGMVKEEASAVFGEPRSSKPQWVGATGETLEYWYYDGLTLTFSEEGRLIGADVTGNAYPGPRGITMGQMPWDVISLFYMDPLMTAADVLYTSGQSAWSDSQLPPCGYIRRHDDETFSIIYVAYAVPDREDRLDPEDFIYEDLATLVVDFNRDGAMTGFHWDRGAWAE